MRRQIKPTNILAEDCLQNEMMKANQMLVASRLNELIDQLRKINKDDQFNKTQAEKAKHTTHRTTHCKGIHRKHGHIKAEIGNGIDKHEWNIKPQN